MLESCIVINPFIKWDARNYNSLAPSFNIIQLD